MSKLREMVRRIIKEETLAESILVGNPKFKSTIKAIIARAIKDVQQGKPSLNMTERAVTNILQVITDYESKASEQI